MCPFALPSLGIRNPNAGCLIIFDPSPFFAPEESLLQYQNQFLRTKEKKPKTLDKCNLSVRVKLKLSLACRGAVGLRIPSRSSRSRVAETRNTPVSRSWSSLEAASELKT